MFFFLLYLQFYAFYFNLFTKIFSKTSRKAVNMSDKLLILDTCLCVKQGTEAFCFVQLWWSSNEIRTSEAFRWGYIICGYNVISFLSKKINSALHWYKMMTCRLECWVWFCQDSLCFTRQEGWWTLKKIAPSPKERERQWVSGEKV